MASTSDSTQNIAPKERSAVEIQQDYYEAVGDAEWELYEKVQRKYLLQKVALALCGPPKKEGNLVGDDKLALQGYEPRDEETCMKVFGKICEQAKYSYNGENIYISLLRIVHVTPKSIKKDWIDLHVKEGKDVTQCLFHVFSVRKCISMKAGVSSCKIFIDHDARVYKTWDDYIKNNNLPKGVIIVPENGEYTGDIKKDKDDSYASVRLSVVPTPALGIGARVLSVTDTISIVASVGSLAGIGVAVAAPVVAPAALAVALGVGVTTGVYSIVRASINLVDRSKHEQSIGLKDSEARSNWISILTSSVGLTFSAASQLVGWVVRTGTNITVFINALQILKYSNLATGAIGVINSLFDMAYKYAKYKEEPSKLELFQFTTSLLFLGIGVMSNQTAQEIVQDAQAKTINEYRDSLSSNNKRKMFDKITAETRRTKGAIQGNADVIRAIKTIEDKDDFFGKLAKINKDLNKNKVRISLSPDGNTLINNEHKVDLKMFSEMGRKNRNNLLKGYGPSKLIAKNAATRIYPSMPQYSAGIKMYNIGNGVLSYISLEEAVKITIFISNLSQLDQAFLAETLEKLSENLHDLFLIICMELISTRIPDTVLPANFKKEIILFVLQYLKSLISECDLENDSGIKIIVTTFIKNGKVDRQIISMLIDRAKEWFRHKNDGCKNLPMHDDLLVSRIKRQINFHILQAGDIVNIGDHNILIKEVTVEKLEEWFQNLPQQKCDVLVEFCFNIIAQMSKEEIDVLNLLNLDEDVIMRVSYYLFKVKGIENLFPADDINSQIFDYTDIVVVLRFKDDLLKWRCKQRIRDHDICKICTGIFYKS